MTRSVLWVILACSSAAFATDPINVDPNDPEVLLKSKLKTVLEVLQNNKLDLAAKEKELNRIVHPLFDFNLMSYLTLGKSNWAKMAPSQRSRFTELFVARMKDSYRDKLAMYSDQVLVYKPATRKGNKIQIPTELVGQDQTVAVLYKMHQNPKKKQGWKLYDVEIQGVSLVKNYRSQFTEVLNKGTIQDLLEKLEKPITKEAPLADPNQPANPS